MDMEDDDLRISHLKTASDIAVIMYSRADWDLAID